MSESKVISNYIKNFPFTTLRDRQENVLREIDSIFASGYKYVILEAPTGFGKSPVAISTALTLGSSKKKVGSLLDFLLLYGISVVYGKDQLR